MADSAVLTWNSVPAEEEGLGMLTASDSLPPGRIEHTSLPSGLHQRDQDLVTFTHGGLPGAGLFRSRAQETGRGRRMGTLGVVLGECLAAV